MIKERYFIVILTLTLAPARWRRSTVVRRVLLDSCYPGVLVGMCYPDTPGNTKE